jgi:hypothetical protein
MCGFETEKFIINLCKKTSVRFMKNRFKKDLSNELKSKLESIFNSVEK